jgi:hypothetical protein
MLKKIMNYLVLCVMLILIIGISFQYYISTDKEPELLVCHKNRLLSRVGDFEAVYTRIKGLSCEYDKGMLIIEERS